MIFTETPLSGAYLIDVEPHRDERGLFARSWCEKEFRDHGLNTRLVQCSISFSDCKGTLRGMHFQLPPHEETKLVRCTAGSIFDVIIDLRPKSPTYCQHFAVELSATNHRMLYVPRGFAHGLQTLEDRSEVFYQMSQEYVSEASRGVRWDDPAFAIEWPLDVTVISPRDRQFPDFVPDPTGRSNKWFADLTGRKVGRHRVN